MTVTPAEKSDSGRGQRPSAEFRVGACSRRCGRSSGSRACWCPAAPAAAGVLSHGTVLWHTVVAVITFSLCASGGYLINDAADVESDRRHPKKRYRPIAAGIVPVMLARVLGIALVARQHHRRRAADLVEARARARRLRRADVLVLDVAEARSGAGDDAGRGRLPAASDRRCGRHRREGEPVVPHRRVVRLALHGRRQAHGRGHRVRRRRLCSPADPRGLPDRVPAPDPRARRPPSPCSPTACGRSNGSTCTTGRGRSCRSSR